MPCNNFKFLISSDSKEHFEMAMKLAFANCPGGKSKHYKISKEKGLILSWQPNLSDFEIRSGWQQLPYSMDLEATSQFAWNWLKNTDTNEYDEFPDHDGDNKKGFCIYNETWGHVDDNHYAFVGIKPEWQMYGK